MKILIPIIEVKTGGSLHDFHYDLFVANSSLVREQIGNNIVITGDIDLTISELVAILDAGGEISEYLMAIQSDIALLGQDLPAGLPNRNKLGVNALPEVRKFNDWFEKSSTLYVNDANTKVYFTTNPYGTSKLDYLYASAIRVIAQIAGYNIQVKTIAQFNADILTGWNLVNIN